MIPPPPRSPLFPYTTLFRSIVTGAKDALAKVLAEHDDVDAVWYFGNHAAGAEVERASAGNMKRTWVEWHPRDRKSTRLNSSHTVISYAVFCLKKKKKKKKKQ